MKKWHIAISIIALLLIGFAAVAACLHGHLPGKEDHCAICQVAASLALIALFMFLSPFTLIKLLRAFVHALPSTANPLYCIHYRGPPLR